MASHGVVVTCLRHVSIVGAYGLVMMASAEMEGEKLELWGQSSALESGSLTLMALLGTLTGV